MKRRHLLYISTFIMAIILLVVFLYLNSLMPIITGYAAKNLCSDVFISGRQPEKIEAIDLNFSFVRFTKNRIDYKEKSVVSRFLWARSKAIYRDGFGVTLIRGISEKRLRMGLYPEEKPEYIQDSLRWPLGNIIPDSVPAGIDKNAISLISRELIDSNAYNGNAFAFMVVHKGIPVVEAYKPDFTCETRFLSWSMAKSFLNTFVGVMVKDCRMDINKAAAIDEWKDDDRSRITLNDLMQMQSGLKWNENYGNRSDVTVMLHCKKDMSRFAYEMPDEFPAGTKWYYSSGSANIVSHLIRKEFGSDSAYYDFAHDSLFEKIGIEDAVFEVDPQGIFVGSSYLYLTARDYARFGMLYQNDGIFNGKRLLPHGWIKYTTTPASCSGGVYGSLFWLNKSKRYSSAPDDMYSCEGHDGQRIFILPSKELIVVVLGCSPTSKGGMNFDALLRDILGTVK